MVRIVSLWLSLIALICTATLAGALLMSQGQNEREYISLKRPLYGSEIMAKWYQENKQDSLFVKTNYSINKIAGIGFDMLDQLGAVGVYDTFIAPTVVHVTIPAGLRREEIADRFAERLGWTDAEKRAFAGTESMCYLSREEGRYYPDVYAVSSLATPEEVEVIMNERFQREVVSVIDKKVPQDVVMNSALRIASMIEREAAGKEDRRLISGIMWNRLHEGMTLDIDATLQYIKGREGNWWPTVLSEDKFIDSPYNTYRNPGLPPSPIANPSLASIAAALNPEPTNCFFYLHDENHGFHCSRTYKEHLRAIERYLK